MKVRGWVGSSITSILQDQINKLKRKVRNLTEKWESRQDKRQDDGEWDTKT